MNSASGIWTAVLCGAVLAVAAVLPAAGREARPRSPVTIVGMADDLGFTPDRIRIAVGDTVEWRNASSVPHTVTTFPDGGGRGHVFVPEGAARFDSGPIAPGGTYRRSFPEPGVYRYVCAFHRDRGMGGTIIVEHRPGQ